MTRPDPLLPFARAARGGARPPLSAGARSDLWRAVEGRRRRELARRGAAFAGAALAAAAVLALVLLPRAPRTDAGRPPAVAHRPAPPAAPGLPAAPPVRDDAVVSALGLDARYVVVRTPELDRVDVTLTAGGVRCDVVHRASRRFVVLADGVRVVDRGTRFDVVLLDRFVAVRVDEGSVEVTAGAVTSTLRAGEAGRFARATPAAPPARRPAVDVAALLADADAAMERAELARAEALLRTVTRQHRAHPRAQAAALRLGRLLREQGRVDEAVRAFEDARAIAPRGALVDSAWSQQVATLVGAGRAAEARSAARRYAAEHEQGLLLGDLRRQGLLP